jgi:hypothetical protein
MPKGPRGEKRPRGVIETAIMVAKIATGEIEEDIDPKSSAAKELGSRGGPQTGANPGAPQGDRPKGCYQALAEAPRTIQLTGM